MNALAISPTKLATFTAHQMTAFSLFPALQSMMVELPPDTYLPALHLFTEFHPPKMLLNREGNVSIVLINHDSDKEDLHIELPPIPIATTPSAPTPNAPSTETLQ